MGIKRTVLGIGAAAVLGLSSAAGATLVNQGNGLIYDTDLNITWLQDANYAATSGYDSDGRMTWSQAEAWVGNLNTAYFKGFNDWRLPTTVGGAPVYGYNGTTTEGYNITSSEMGHLYYQELGNLGRFDTNGQLQPGWGTHNSGPFTNLQAYIYWSDTESVYLQAWAFDMNYGAQASRWKENFNYAVWAVRDGSSAPVPEPGAVLLLGSGLAGLVGGARRRRK